MGDIRVLGTVVVPGETSSSGRGASPELAGTVVGTMHSDPVVEEVLLTNIEGSETVLNLCVIRGLSSGTASSKLTWRLCIVRSIVCVLLPSEEDSSLSFFLAAIGAAFIPGECINGGIGGND